MADEEQQQQPPTKPPETMADDTKGGRFFVSGYRPSSGFARRLCTTLSVVLLLAGLISLILYLVYRPSKPRFSVAGASVYNLRTSNSTSSPISNALSTSMQFTVVAHNPSDRSSIFYDRLSAYVAYREAAITPPAPMPPLYQEKGSTVALSPVLGGDFVPVAPEVAEGLKTDRAYGVVSLRLVLLGRVRYRSGPFRSGWAGLYVRCDMLLGLRRAAPGQVPLLGEPKCNVDA